MRVREAKVVHELELSELVRETYGRPYQLQQQGEMMSQDSILMVTVPDAPMGWGGPSLEEWSSRDVDTPPEGVVWERSYQRDLWWDREYYPDYQEVLNDLHRRGLLPSGDYVIHVWW